MSNSSSPTAGPVNADISQLDIYGSISCLVGILVIVIFLIFPTSIPRKRKSSIGDRDCLSGACDRLKTVLPDWFIFPLDYSTVPVMVVLILWAMQVISLVDIWRAIKGHADSNLKPYSIIILFFTLAYMSLSLDVTGLFDFIAAKAIALSGGSGLRLFLTFFTLSSIITIATSNDIVILTLTPIICAMASYASLSEATTSALLFAQFFAANLWSMLLFIGNPTNIVVAQAFQLDFLEYSRWMALPTVAAGLTCLIVLFAIFSKLNAIPPVIQIPVLNPYQNFIDIPGAIFGSVIFAICIGFIATSTVTNIPIWIITVSGCAIMIVKDAVFDFRLRRRIATVPQALSPSEITIMQPGQAQDTDVTMIPLEHFMVSSDESDIDAKLRLGQPPVSDPANALEDHLNQVPPLIDPPEIAKDENTDPAKNASFIKKVEPVLPIVISRLPWKVAPFVVGVFIVVESMSVTGLTGWIAKAFSLLVGASDSHGAIFTSVFLAAFTSTIVCNIVNNQPMTIMYTNVLLSPLLKIGPKSLKGALFSVVAGSNIGGNVTLVGALAGIMWKSILSDKGIPLSAAQFSIYGCITMLPVLVATSITLYAEIVAWA